MRGKALMPTAISNDASIADIAPTLKDGAVFAAQVLHRMTQERKSHGPVVARIGITGKGVIPNFRIDTVSGEPIKSYDGQSYEPFSEINTYDKNWSTASMTFEEVRELVAKMRGIKLKAPDA
jgi:hypothetical protein